MLILSEPFARASLTTLQAPSIWAFLDQWVRASAIGSRDRRQGFANTYLVEPDNILEILLRLVRGERATCFPASARVSQASNVSSSSMATLERPPVPGAQQTHVSLAVLAIFRLMLEYAERANATTGTDQARARVLDVIRRLPTQLLSESLDGIFNEWEAASTNRTGS